MWRVWIVACVLVCSVANAENSTENASSQGFKQAKAYKSAQDLDANLTQDLGESTTNLASKQDLLDFFAPASILGDTYGTFAVGYQMLSKYHSLKNITHSAFFALDRGWIFVDNALLLALTLDGSAGEFYAINLGVKLGYRTLSGRIIPSIAVSYGLLNHKDGDLQHNFHGATATLSLFTDIAQGFGLEVGYRVGLHTFHTIKKSDFRANLHSFMINFRFMDFGI